MRRRYDIVLAGAGLAGLCAARALQRRAAQSTRVLIVDPRLGQCEDKTISLWGDVPAWLEPDLAHTWHQMRLRFPTWSRVEDLGAQRYHALSAADFSRRALADLAADPRFDLARGRVEAVADGEERAHLRVDGVAVEAGYILRGFGPNRVARQTPPMLLQHFGGWEIETDAPTFDPGCMTLMDFAIPQRDGPTFLYVLPFSERRALVEYTVFSPRPLTRADYDRALAVELAARVEGYRVLRSEYGVLPMAPTPRPRGQRVLDIGAGAGMLRPSTGFAFRRTLEQTSAVVDGIVNAGRPGRRRRTTLRHRVYDQLLLSALLRDGDQGARLFDGLFRRNAFADVLRFMGEQTGRLEELRLFARLPLGPFVRGLGPAWRARQALLAAP